MNFSKKIVRIMSLILCVAIMSTTIPLSVFAADEQDTSRPKKRLIVKYKNYEKSKEINEVAEKRANWVGTKNNKLKKIKEIKRLKMDVVEVDASTTDVVINEFKKNAEVETVQEDYPVTINMIPQDDMFSQQSALYNTSEKNIDVNALKAWDEALGEGITVGVLDTGVDINHTDLKDSIYVNKNEIPGDGIDNDGNGFIDDINGWDFANNDNTVMDSAENDAHGTHVSGIIASGINNNGSVGLAPKAKILPLKFITNNVGYTSGALAAIDYAKNLGVKIINCAWGSPEYNPLLESAMKASGMLFICASGNSSKDIETSPIYPAAFSISNVISVASCDSTGSLALFSNFGKNVDIAAPGVDILSTLPNQSYGNKSGTSMSTGFVSAAAALVASKYPSADVATIKNKILANTKKVDNLVNSVKYGALDAYSALVGTNTIEDEDDKTWEERFPNGTFAFKNNYVFADEAGGEAEIVIYRLGGSKGQAKVSIALTPAKGNDGNTANAAGNKDFIVTSPDNVVLNAEEEFGTTFLDLLFQEGEAEKTIKIKAVDDTIAEPEEFILATIADVTGAEMTESANRLTIGIRDNEAVVPSKVGFTVEESTFDKSSGTAKLKVVRTGGTQYVFSVDYKAVENTAKEGVDFAKTAGTLAFNCGVDTMEIEVPLINDGIYMKEPNMDFTLELSNAKGGEIESGKSVIHLNNTATGEEPVNVATMLYSPDVVDLTGNITTAEKAISKNDSKISVIPDIMKESDPAQYVVPDYAPDKIMPFTYAYPDWLNFGANTGPWSSMAIIGGLSISTQRSTSSTTPIDGLFEFYDSIEHHFRGKTDHNWSGLFENTIEAYIGNSGINKRTLVGPTTGNNAVHDFGTHTTNLYDMTGGWSFSDLRTYNNIYLEISNETDDDLIPNDIDGRIYAEYFGLNRVSLGKNIQLVIHTADDDILTGINGNGGGIYNYLKPQVAFAPDAGGADANGYAYIGSKLNVSANSNSGSYKLWNNTQNQGLFFKNNATNKIVAFGNTASQITLRQDTAAHELLDKNAVSNSSNNYSLNVVMTREQNIQLDFTASVPKDSNGDMDNTKIEDTKNTLKEKLKKATYQYKEVDVTKGGQYSEQKTGVLSLAEPVSGTQFSRALTNVKSINFGLPAEDYISFNGILYKGNQDIIIPTDCYRNTSLTFLYVSKESMAVINKMSVVSYDNMEVFVDLNSNGVIDTTDCMLFTINKNQYEESDFAPIYLETDSLEGYTVPQDGMYKKLIKIKYTKIPRSFAIPAGVNPSLYQCEIIPSFSTAITNDVAKAKLSKEMQGPRIIDIGTTGYAPMYGGASTIGQITIPLGGDLSPSYFDELQKKFVWQPNWKGNLKTLFTNPQGIYLDNTTMPNHFPAATTSEQINAYLGSFGSNDTIILSIKEKNKDIESFTGAPFRSFPAPPSASMEQDADKGKSNTPAGVNDANKGTPNVAQSSPSFSLPAINIPIGPVTMMMDEYEMGFSIGVPIFSASKTTSTSTREYKGKKTDTTKTTTKTENIKTQSSEGINQMREFMNDPKGMSSDAVKDAFKKLRNAKNGIQQGGTSIKPKGDTSAEFNVGVNATFMWKYSTIDEQWHFSSGMIFLSVGGEVRQNVRLSVFPIVYVYIVFGMQLDVGLGVKVDQDVDAQGNRNQHVYFSGATISPKMFIEAGVGIGVEICKVEIFLKVSVGCTITLGKDGGNPSFDKFETMAALGLRVVFLFFSFEMDAISFKLDYEKGRKDNQGNPAEWQTHWKAFGQDIGGSTLSTYSLDGTPNQFPGAMGARLYLPKRTYDMQIVKSPKDNDNGENINTYAISFNDVPFELGSYNSSANAYKLADGLNSASDYKLITVGQENYILYSIDRGAASSSIDQNMLVMSKLQNNGAATGLLHPDPSSTSKVNYLTVDNDEAGDLDFNAYVEENKIYVTWTGYNSTTAEPNSSADDVLAKSRAKTVVKTAVFDTENPQKGFTNTVQLSTMSELSSYKFLPKGGNKVIFYAQTKQYSDAEEESADEAYKNLLRKQNPNVDNSLTSTATSGDGSIDPYASVKLGMNAKMNELYGKYSTMNFSVLQSDGSYITTKLEPDASWKNAGLRIDNAVLKTIDDNNFYLAYTTSEKGIIGTTEVTVKKLFLQKGRVSNFSPKGVTLGSPLLLKSVVDSDIDDVLDGVYARGARTEAFANPFFANLQFIEGKLDPNGNKETLFTFNMNNTNYVVNQANLESMTGALPGGTISKFFDVNTLEGDNKADFTIGVDGDGNISAIYTQSMPSTSNNALFVTKYDSKTGSWGIGKMLAMRNMTTYENATTGVWAKDVLKAEYDKDLKQLIFQKPQIALGKPETTTPAGVTQPGSMLIITQTVSTELEKKTQTDGNTYIIPATDATTGRVKPSVKGFYAMSYGIGAQSIGEENLSFANESFVPGSILSPRIRFKNTGDAAIRGSKDQPISVNLMIGKEGEEQEKLASWSIPGNIAAGAAIDTLLDNTTNIGGFNSLSAETLTLPLPKDLKGKVIYFTVKEDATYFTDKPFSYDSRKSSHGTGRYEIDDKAELFFDNLKVSTNGEVSMVNGVKTVKVDIAADVSNKGVLAADDVKLKVEYCAGKNTEDKLIYRPVPEVGTDGEALLGSIDAKTGKKVFKQTYNLPLDYYDLTTPNKSMDLRFTIKSSTAEYEDSNNILTKSIDAATSFEVPDHITMQIGKGEKVPVKIVTTLEGALSNISVTEIVEAGKEPLLTSLLYSSTDSTVNLTANKVGAAIVRIADLRTGCYKDVVVASETSQVNISNHNPSIKFAGQDWEYLANQIGSYNDDLASTKQGSFTFSTKAEAIDLYFKGNIKVESTFYGLSTKTYTSNDFSKATKIDFANVEGLEHTVTVTATDDMLTRTIFDKYCETFGAGTLLPPSTDTDAPVIMFSKSFPESGTLKTGTSFDFNAYIMDESQLAYVSVDNIQKTTANSKLMTVPISISSNGSCSIVARNAAGKQTVVTIPADWFKDGVQNPVWPELTVNLTDKNNNPLTGIINEDAQLSYSAKAQSPDTIQSNYYDTASGLPNQLKSAANALTGNIVVDKNGYYEIKAIDKSGRWTRAVTFVDLIDRNGIDITFTRLQTQAGSVESFKYSVKKANGLGSIDSITVNGTGISIAKDQTEISGVYHAPQAGAYKFVVKDNTGNEAARTYYTSGNAIKITDVAVKNVISQSRDDGKITVTVTGGAGTYEYSISDGEWQSSNTFENLVPGTYAISVRNQGESFVATVTNPVIVADKAVSFTASLKHNEFINISKGEIAVAAAGGDGKYEYSKGDDIWQDSNTFTGLAAGDYTLSVRDKENIINLARKKVVIGQPSLVDFTTTVKDSVNQSRNDGKITVTATGGKGTYKYSIKRGNDGSGWQISNVFEDLTPGTYGISVRDEQDRVNIMTKDLIKVLDRYVPTPSTNNQGSSSVQTPVSTPVPTPTPSEKPVVEEDDDKQPSVGTVDFKDVLKTAWYYDAVNFIALRSITTGTGNGYFSPDNKLTRGQCIVMLMKAYDIKPDINPTNNFSDAGNTYYTGYLSAAKRLRISSGVGNNKFKPNGEITRQELVVFLYNVLKMLNKLPAGEGGSELSSFKDSNEVANWAKDAMSLFTKLGIIVGSEGKVLPHGITTRAEMAQILYNLLK